LNGFMVFFVFLCLALLCVPAFSGLYSFQGISDSPPNAAGVISALDRKNQVYFVSLADESIFYLSPTVPGKWTSLLVFDGRNRNLTLDISSFVIDNKNIPHICFQVLQPQNSLRLSFYTTLKDDGKTWDNKTLSSNSKFGPVMYYHIPKNILYITYSAITNRNNVIQFNSWDGESWKNFDDIDILPLDSFTSFAAIGSSSVNESPYTIHVVYTRGPDIRHLQWRESRTGNSVDTAWTVDTLDINDLTIGTSCLSLAVDTTDSDRLYVSILTGGELRLIDTHNMNTTVLDTGLTPPLRCSMLISSSTQLQQQVIYLAISRQDMEPLYWSSNLNSSEPIPIGLNSKTSSLIGFTLQSDTPSIAVVNSGVISIGAVCNCSDGFWHSDTCDVLSGIGVTCRSCKECTNEEIQDTPCSETKDTTCKPRKDSTSTHSTTCPGGYELRDGKCHRALASGSRAAIIIFPIAGVLLLAWLSFYTLRRNTKGQNYSELTFEQEGTKAADQKTNEITLPTSASPDETPLIAACENGYLDTVQDLVENGGQSLLPISAESKIPLACAIWSGNPHLIQYVINRLGSASSDWRDCVAHNQLYYNSIYATDNVRGDYETMKFIASRQYYRSKFSHKLEEINPSRIVDLDLIDKHC